MKMVVVGGNSHGIGKTSVAAGIISALPHRKWLAIKLTQFGHGVCSVDGHDCDCTPEDHPFSILDERDRSGATDTSRFLVAGAQRALWVRVRWGMLETVIPSLRSAIDGAANVIIESNSILRYYEPNVYLSVLEPATADFKVSAREFLPKADAFVSLAPTLANALWDGIPAEQLRAKPVFPVTRDCYVTPEIAKFVEDHLTTETAARFIASPT